MNSAEFVEIRNQIPNLRRMLVQSPQGSIPKSIEFLNSMIADANSLDDKAALYTLLLSECGYFRSDELTVYFLRKQVLDLPNDPLPMTSLALKLAQSTGAQSEALLIAERAIEVAKLQNRQVKYSLTCLARVALASGNYDIFNQALAQLVDDADQWRAEDLGLEFDFIDQVDSSRADARILSKYRALRRR
jgi:hypothetical protein